MAGTLDETVTVHCVTDFKLNMPTVSGRTALMHALARRLQTPRGRVPRWPNYGTDIRSLLLSKASPNLIVSAAVREIEKDERVEQGSTSVAVTITDSGRAIKLDISVNDGEGPFEFTMTIDEAVSSLIELQKAS